MQRSEDRIAMVEIARQIQSAILRHNLNATKEEVAFLRIALRADAELTQEYDARLPHKGRAS